ncbi:family 43 glycosylhydrolase [Marinoscillum sp. MHG1-6]|uniref:family 43 glycosylhydrolase n=1 Tax=Marinoscillum sp. MHG1-6 TaxID=2959627 RepID=UPI00215879FC|nr:family 43 glycosylhydrolase [Marinoscillum sp. MHG1-6]
MNRLSLVFAVLWQLVLLSCETRPPQQEEVFLFSYFKGGGEDGLHLAYSEDGLTWKALNEDQPYLKPELSADRLMRDPCIIQGPDSKFHMVWTVSWSDGGIGYASSVDLINWSPQQFIPVMQHEPATKNCWAPEIFYVENRDEFMIYWSSTIPGKFEETANSAEQDWNHRIYYCTTRDFKEFSETELLLDPGFNVIDATIKVVEDRYVMIVKDETKFPEVQKNLHVLVSEDLYSWDVSVSDAISDDWVEGPTMTKLDANWVVYFDRYRQHAMGALSSSDLVNWTDISSDIDFPKGTRHGTVFKVSTTVVENLKNPDPADLNKLKALIPAPKPLYRDTIHDGAADPVIVWNQSEEKWYMFYTNRRANVDSLDGVKWVHGTRIGIAESEDGKFWKYKGVCNIQYGEQDYSHWAPEVIAREGTYHMYLTIVPGTFSNWKHPRHIIHLTSANLIDWEYESTLPLANDKCIDACVFPKPDGTWRMYYNNERDGKSIYYADSPDLYTWTDSGKKVVSERGEGPKVFQWKEKYWMVVDNWEGLGVYFSNDLENWQKQENRILQRPGKYTDDRVKGQHPDVVVQGEKAFIYYFTHPGKTPENAGIDNYETRRSSLQVAELIYDEGEIKTFRNRPVYVQLTPSK